MRICVLYHDPRESSESTAGLESEEESLHVAEDVTRILLNSGHNAEARPYPKGRGGKAELGGFDLVFNLCDSFKGSNYNLYKVPLLLEGLGVPFVGCDSRCMRLATDKSLAKRAIERLDIQTPKWQIIRVGESPRPRVGFPAIVKPMREDASIGIDELSVCRDERQLSFALARVHNQYKQAALVEEFIDGREINSAIMEIDQNPTVLPLSEIRFVGFPSEYPRIVSYRAKWVTDSPEYKKTVRKVPTELPSVAARYIRDTSLRIFKSLDCHDFVRVDFRLDRNGDPYVLEINPNPSISRESGFAASAIAAGMSYEDMIVALVENAAGRYGITKA
jgi:D-alanine-D-alanine ligase